MVSSRKNDDLQQLVKNLDFVGNKEDVDTYRRSCTSLMRQIYYNYVVTDIHSIGMMVPVSVVVVKILGIAIATSFLRQVRHL